jgi:hypothetical protein
VNAFHQGQIDHESAIDSRAPGNVVTAPTNCHFEAQLSRKFDGIHNVRDTATPRDKRRSFVRESVVNFSSIFIASVARRQEFAGEGCGEIDDGIGNGRNGGHDVLLICEAADFSGFSSGEANSKISGLR